MFCNRKREVAQLHRSLVRHGFNAAALHGDLDQSARTAALESFRKGEVTLLIASDVAARGLDIPDVSHIFNFDVPHHADDYVHRIGRTGRAGKSGTAITIVGAGRRQGVAAIEKLIGQSIAWAGEPPRAEPPRARRPPGRSREHRRDRDDGRRHRRAAAAPRDERPRATIASRARAPRAQPREHRARVAAPVARIDAGRGRARPARRMPAEPAGGHLPAFLLRPVARQGLTRLARTPAIYRPFTDCANIVACRLSCAATTIWPMRYRARFALRGIGDQAMTEPTGEHERTMAFAEIALGQIKALRQPATPRNYEVWYTYATGYNPSLNQTINETLARNGTLTDADLEQVYATYISPTRLTDKIDNVGSRVMDEIDQVMAMIGRGGRLRQQLHREPGRRQRQARQRQGPRGPARHRRKPGGDRQRDEAEQPGAGSSGSTPREQEINQLQENLEVVRTESLTDPLTGARQPQVLRQPAAEGDRGGRRAQRAAVAGDDRHRPFQDVQRHLGPSDRRPGAAPRRHVAEAERQGPGHRRALRRRGIRGDPAEHRAALGADGRRPHPPRGDVEGTDEALDRPEPRPRHDLARRRHRAARATPRNR